MAQPQVDSLPMAASNFSLAPFPVVGADSHNSSSSGVPFTPESADLLWHLRTLPMYLLRAFATPSSHFPVAPSGGTLPVSSGMVVVVVDVVVVAMVKRWAWTLYPTSVKLASLSHATT